VADTRKRRGQPWWAVSVVAASVVLALLILNRPTRTPTVSVSKSPPVTSPATHARAAVVRPAVHKVQPARVAVKPAPVTIPPVTIPPVTPTTAKAALLIQLPRTG